MLNTLYKFIVGAPNPCSYSPVDKSNHSTPMAPQPQLDWDKVKNLLEASVIQTRIALEEPSWSNKASEKSYSIAIDEAAAPAIKLLNEAAAEISLYRDNSLFEKFRETVNIIRKELDKVENDWSNKVEKKAFADSITWEFRRGVGSKIWMEAIGARMRCDPRKEQSKFFPNPDPKIKEHEA